MYILFFEWQEFTLKFPSEGKKIHRIKNNKACSGTP
jgi:hypothetical protein